MLYMTCINVAGGINKNETRHDFLREEGGVIESKGTRGTAFTVGRTWSQIVRLETSC